MEKLIIRSCYNEFFGRTGYYAIFTDVTTLRGNVMVLPFVLTDTGAIFEAHEEVETNYLTEKTKLVRKNSPEALRCLAEVEKLHGEKYRLAEKIMRRRTHV